MKNGMWVPDTVHMGYGVTNGAQTPTFYDSYESRVDQMLRLTDVQRFGLAVEYLDVRGAGAVKVFFTTVPEIGNPMTAGSSAGGYRSTGIGTQVNPSGGFIAIDRNIDQLDLVDGVLYYLRQGGTRTAVHGVALQSYLAWRVEYSHTTGDAWSLAWRVWYYME